MAKAATSATPNPCPDTGLSPIDEIVDAPVRPRLLTSLVLNVVALGALWFAYSTIRSATASSFRTAVDNAERLIAFQDWIGLPSEANVQSLLLDYEWLVRGANVYYISAHFPVMIVFLVAVMAWRREWMPRVRWGLIGATLAGLVIHLAFPLEPPRMRAFDGFVDTAKAFGPDPYALGVAKAANQLAAMPSMHVGWALLIAMGVIAIFKTRWRWLVLLHPIITTCVVVVTANHYWTDVIVGALLALAGWKIAGWVRPAKLAPVEAPRVEAVSGADQVVDLRTTPEPETELQQA